jgi:hypothetical protein
MSESEAEPDESELDTSRTVVQTYVPAYQREEWDAHAEQLGMSRSEFVKTMVQAGRAGFGADPARAGEGESSDHSSEPLAERVRAVLAESGPLSWEDLLAEVSGDIESRLEDALDELQDAGEVRHSGRQGGYVLDGEIDE